MSAILFNRMIGPIPVDVIISEAHWSSLGITEIPIETGAKITDHSYVEPKRLELSFGDKGGAATYNALVRFQATRTPFTVVSGLFVYKSMLIKDISAERDETYSCVLKGSCVLQEVITVKTARTAASGEGDGKKAAGTGTPKDQPTKDRTDSTTGRGDQPIKRLDNESDWHYRNRVAGINQERPFGGDKQ